MDILAGLRDGSGVLPAFTSVGAYPLVYLTRSNDVLCAECANKPVDELTSPPVTGEVHWEGAPLDCEECGTPIESAYGMTDGERIAGELECATGAADVAAMLDALSLADVASVMSHYGIPETEEAPMAARYQEIARRAGWTLL